MIDYLIAGAAALGPFVVLGIALWRRDSRKRKGLRFPNGMPRVEDRYDDLVFTLTAANPFFEEDSQGRRIVNLDDGSQLIYSSGRVWDEDYNYVETIPDIAALPVTRPELPWVVYKDEPFSVIKAGPPTKPLDMSSLLEDVDLTLDHYRL